jgi:bisphosphoglycerate-dependent phosphoglycerate mutase
MNDTKDDLVLLRHGQSNFNLKENKYYNDHQIGWE